MGPNFTCANDRFSLGWAGYVLRRPVTDGSCGGLWLKMEQTFIRQTLIDRMRRHGEALEQAAAAFARGMGVTMSELTPVIGSIRREGRENMLLDSPPGVYGRSVADEARMAGWYTGPEEGDEIWPRLRAKLESGN